MGEGLLSYDAARHFVTEPRPQFLRPRAPASGPDFIIIGTRHAGADWLGSALYAHPSVWQPPIADLSYFASLYLPYLAPTEAMRRRTQVEAARAWWRENGVSRPEARASAHRQLDYLDAEHVTDDWYRGLFSFSGVDQVTGEVSQDNLLLPRSGIRHLRSVCPDVRVILLLRDPAERALAHAAQIAASNDEQAILQVLRTHIGSQLLCYSDIARLTRLWRSVIGEEKLLILTYRRLLEQPWAVLQRVCEFLGVVWHPALFDIEPPSSPQLPGPHSGAASWLRTQLTYVYDELSQLDPTLVEWLQPTMAQGHIDG
jgi:hypothetical protein